jgi:hypothetical protein
MKKNYRHDTKEVNHMAKEETNPTIDDLEGLEELDLDDEVEVVEEDSEEEETPQGIRPNDLAKELGVDGKRVRAWLRVTYPRKSDEKNTNWFLSDDQAQAVRARFTPTTDEDDESETEDEG